jgi:hypothetical protein
MRPGLPQVSASSRALGQPVARSRLIALPPVSPVAGRYHRRRDTRSKTARGTARRSPYDPRSRRLASPTVAGGTSARQSVPEPTADALSISDVQLEWGAGMLLPSYPGATEKCLGSSRVLPDRNVDQAPGLQAVFVRARDAWAVKISTMAVARGEVECWYQLTSKSGQAQSVKILLLAPSQSSAPASRFRVAFPLQMG